jgi:hypothetical protein
MLDFESPKVRAGSGRGIRHSLALRAAGLKLLGVAS